MLFDFEMDVYIITLITFWKYVHKGYVSVFQRLLFSEYLYIFLSCEKG